MPKRTLDVTDTFSSPSEPIVPITVTSQLASFVDDAAYEAAKGSAGSVGDIYLNTTTNLIRYYNGTAWVTQQNVLNNSAAADPVVGDDNTQGYSEGSIWINTTTDDIYIAADVSTGAAVWQQVNGAGGGGEINTASNQGAGSQVFKQKTGVDLEFRTLAEGNNITLTQGADTIEISSSGGAGSLNTVFQITNEIDDDNASNWSSGNAADPVAGGGTLQGTFADESGSPLAGTQSFRYTQAAGSLNDYILCPLQSVDEASRASMASARWKHKYTGNDGDIRFVIIDITNSEILLSKELDGSSVVLNPRELFFLRSNTANLRAGYQVLVENIGAVLDFDDIDVEDRPFSDSGSIATEWAEYTPTTQGFGTVSGMDAKWRQVGDSIEIQARWTNGTLAATEAQFGLPNGFTVDAVKMPGLKLVGKYLISDNVIFHGGGILATGGDSFVNFGISDTFRGVAAQSLNPTTGTLTGVASGDISFHALIPVTELSSQDFLITQEEEALNDFCANIDSAGTVLSENASFISSVTKGGTGIYTINFNSGLFSVSPSPTAVGQDTRNAFCDTISSTSCRVTVRDSGGNSLTDSPFQLKVCRQGSDFRSPLIPKLNVTSVTFLKDVKATNTPAGSSIAGTQVRELNTKTFVGSDFLTLSSNQFTLIPGEYLIEATAPFYQVGGSQAFIYNVTDAATESDLVGAPIEMVAGQGGQNILSGSLVLSQEKTFELRQYTRNAVATRGLGDEENSGQISVYSQVKITKVR